MKRRVADRSSLFLLMFLICPPLSQPPLLEGIGGTICDGAEVAPDREPVPWAVQLPISIEFNIVDLPSLVSIAKGTLVSGRDVTIGN